MPARPIAAPLPAPVPAAVAPAPIPSVSEEAVRLFGPDVSRPGVHFLEPDAQGFVRFIVVAADRRLLVSSALDARHATPETWAIVWGWYDLVSPPSSPLELSCLLDRRRRTRRVEDTALRLVRDGE